METLRLTYLGISLLMIVVSLPLIARIVPPNRWYGFRLPGAFRDPEIWYEINAYGGRLLLVLGICLLVTLFVLERVPGMNVDLFSTAFAGVLGVVSIVITVMAVGYYRKLMAMYRPDE